MPANAAINQLYNLRASEKGEKQLDVNAASMLIYIMYFEDAGIPYLIAKPLSGPKIDKGFCLLFSYFGAASSRPASQVIIKLL